MRPITSPLLQQNNNNNYPCLGPVGPGPLPLKCPRPALPLSSRPELGLTGLPLIRGLRAWALCSKSRHRPGGPLGQAPVSCPRPADVHLSDEWGLALGLDARRAGIGALVATLQSREGSSRTQTQSLFLRTAQAPTPQPGGVLRGWLRSRTGGAQAQPMHTAASRARERSGRRWRKSANHTAGREKVHSRQLRLDQPRRICSGEQEPREEFRLTEELTEEPSKEVPGELREVTEGPRKEVPEGPREKLTEGPSKVVPGELRKSTDEPRGELSEELIEKVTEKVTEKLTEEITEPREELTEELTEKLTEEITEKLTEEITEPREELTEELIEEVTEKPRGEFSEELKDVTEGPTEKLAEELIEKVTEKLTEELREEIAELRGELSEESRGELSEKPRKVTENLIEELREEFRPASREVPSEQIREEVREDYEKKLREKQKIDFIDHELLLLMYKPGGVSLVRALIEESLIKLQSQTLPFEEPHNAALSSAPRSSKQLQNPTRVELEGAITDELFHQGSANDTDSLVCSIWDPACALSSAPQGGSTCKSNTEEADPLTVSWNGPGVPEKTASPEEHWSSPTGDRSYPGSADPERVALRDPAPGDPEWGSIRDPAPDDPERCALKDPALDDPERCALRDPAPDDPERCALRDPAPDDPERGALRDPALDDPEWGSIRDPAPDDPERCALRDPAPDDPERCALRDPAPDDPERGALRDPALDDPERCTLRDPAPDDPERCALRDPAPDDPDRCALKDPAPDDPERCALRDPAPDDPEAGTLRDPAPDDPEPGAPRDPAPDDPEQGALKDPAPDDPEQCALKDPAPDDPEAGALRDPAPDDPERGALRDPAPDDPERCTLRDPAPDDPERGALRDPAPDDPERGALRDPAPDDPEPGALRDPEPDDPEAGALKDPAPDDPERGALRDPAPDDPERYTLRDPAPDDPEQGALRDCNLDFDREDPSVELEFGGFVQAPSAWSPECSNHTWTYSRGGTCSGWDQSDSSWADFPADETEQTEDCGGQWWSLSSVEGRDPTPGTSLELGSVFTTAFPSPLGHSLDESADCSVPTLTQLLRGGEALKDGCSDQRLLDLFHDLNRMIDRRVSGVSRERLQWSLDLTPPPPCVQGARARGPAHRHLSHGHASTHPGLL